METQITRSARRAVRASGTNRYLDLVDELRAAVRERYDVHAAPFVTRDALAEARDWDRRRWDPAFARNRPTG